MRKYNLDDALDCGDIGNTQTHILDDWYVYHYSLASKLHNVLAHVCMDIKTQEICIWVTDDEKCVHCEERIPDAVKFATTLLMMDAPEA